MFLRMFLHYVCYSGEISRNLISFMSQRRNIKLFQLILIRQNITYCFVFWIQLVTYFGSTRCQRQVCSNGNMSLKLSGSSKDIKFLNLQTLEFLQCKRA